jgi:glycosyltransferase involved in cell wall biosynthesis
MFNFIPKQPAKRIPEFMAASDVAFLSLMDSSLFSMTIPAKLHSYMACGMPNIASAAGETDKIIKDSNSGLCSRPGNAEELANNIIELSRKSKEELKQLGNNARKYYDSYFNENLLLDKMDRYFSEAYKAEENANV